MSHESDTELKETFWKEMGKSPFVMLELDDAPHTAVPMTAQLDKEAHGMIWFFTSRHSEIAGLGAATATFAGKDHKLFARFAGQLTEERSRERLDKFWTNAVAAWFPQGRDSPDVLLMRMDLGEASIWDAQMGALNVSKMLLGMNVRDTVKGQHAHTQL